MAQLKNITISLTLSVTQRRTIINYANTNDCIFSNQKEFIEKAIKICKEAEQGPHIAVLEFQYQYEVMGLIKTLRLGLWDNIPCNNHLLKELEEIWHFFEKARLNNTEIKSFL
jgi:Ser-tRNA(Ala) deacylase AlaX